MGWLADLFAIVPFLNGVPLPQRRDVNFEGAGVNVLDDGTKQRTRVIISGAPATGQIPSPLQVGGPNGPQIVYCPPINTTDNTTAPLFPAAVAIPAGKQVKIRATIQAGIVTPDQYIPFNYVAVAVFTRPTSGSASLSGGSNVEQTISSYPWAFGANPVTVTGAADNGAGLIRLAVASSPGTAGYMPGQTITVAGTVISGGPVLNGQWIVDSVFNSTHLDLRGSNSTGLAYTSGGTITPNGTVGASLVSNAVQITATGITAAAWLASEGVHLGDVRSNVNGTFLYTGSGTTSNTGPGPSGSSGTDGTAPFERLSAGTAVPIIWQVPCLEIYTT